MFFDSFICSFIVGHQFGFSPVSSIPNKTNTKNKNKNKKPKQTHTFFRVLI
jgi:hypothetical protein